MVLNRQGYDDLIMYLTQNLALFEKPGEIKPGAPTVIELIEDVIAEKQAELSEAAGQEAMTISGVAGMGVEKALRRLNQTVAAYRKAELEEEEAVE